VRFDVIKQINYQVKDVKETTKPECIVYIAARTIKPIH